MTKLPRHTSKGVACGICFNSRCGSVKRPRESVAVIKPWLCKITRCYSKTNLSLHCIKLCERPKHVRRHDTSNEATSRALVEVLPSPAVVPREESLGGLEVAKCLGSRLWGFTQGDFTGQGEEEVEGVAIIYRLESEKTQLVCVCLFFGECLLEPVKDC